MAEINRLNKQHPLYQEDLKYILNISHIDQLKGKRFLITGASGMIGVCFIDALMQFNKSGANIFVYAVGRSKERAKDRLGEYYSDDHFLFIEQDVCNPLPSNITVDFIIPLASNTHPVAYSQYPIETMEINIKGAEFALKKAQECGATLLYPSTVEVYGNARGEDVFTEDYTGQLNLSNSRACYTESKRASEALCQSYISQKNLNIKIVRLSRVFGPTMLMSDTKASSQFIINALQSKNIVLKSKGEQFFSYTYVADVVSAMLYVLLNGEIGVPYNISSNECNVHLKDFALACSRWARMQVVFDIPSEIEKRGFSVAMQAVLDNQRLRELGWVARYAFSNAIERTLDIMENR